MRLYLAAIRTAHDLAGFEAPQQHPLVAQVARGFARATDGQSRRLNRVPLTTAAAVAITAYGLSAFERGRLRDGVAAAALIFAFVFFARPATVRHQRVAHVSVRAGELRVRLSHEKGKLGPLRDQQFVQLQAQQTCPNPFLLLAKALAVARTSGAEYWFGGSEPLPYATLREWWEAVPAAAGCAPPPVPGRWLPHSGRSGGASAALQAGAPDTVVQQRGGWKSSRAMLGYVYAVSRHPADHVFLGYLSPLVQPYQ
jgi:integrase